MPYTLIDETTVQRPLTYTAPFATEHERRLFYRAGTLFDEGEFAGALHAWEQLRQAYPSEAMLYFVLGRCEHSLHSFEKAAALYRTALELDPNLWHARYQLGALLLDEAKYHQAIEVFYALLQRHPEDGDTWTLLGGALSKTGEQDAAVECCRQALALNPDNAAAMYNLSFASTVQGRPDEALEWIRKALAIQPGVPLFHMQHASLLLRAGRYAEGWREWEWRLLKKDFRGLNVRSAHPALWKGEALEGRTLLVWCEQGLGDTIQFMRYLKLAQAQGARIIFECQKELMPIAAAVEGIDVLFERFGQCPEHFDYHVPLMSLPLLFGTAPDTIPAGGGYLDPARMKALAGRVSISRDGSLAVGLAWEGSRHNPVNHYRSCSPQDYAPLCDVQGCRFHSVQSASSEIGLPASIHALGMQSMAEVAGAIASLDLVITIDTSVAHLAGAMGKEVWLLLSVLSDWRWELERDSSPWYRTLRIIRQRKLGEWEPVMAEAAAMLHDRIMNKQSHQH